MIKIIGAIYYRSRYFWMTSRALVVIFLGDLFLNQNGKLETGIQISVAATFLLYLMSMLYLILVDVTKKAPRIRALEIITGLSTILLSLLMSLMTFVVGYDLMGVQSYLLYIIFLFLFLLGFYELLAKNS